MEKFNRETIKPSCVTPSSLRTYNLSSLDQLIEQSYVSLILFYEINRNWKLSAQHKSQVLKKALSQCLTRYYPFAGRLCTPTSTYVDCNDEGVVYIEAQNDRELKTLQHITEHDETLDLLFPDGLNGTSIVGVQVNHFACGGIGVAVCMSHIIGDACTLSSFLNYWASVARYGSADHVEVRPLNPHFIRSTTTNSVRPEVQVINQGYTNLVSRNFVFPNTKLCELKNKVIAMTAGSIQNPTRVEVLTSLLYKTAMAAATTISGYFKPSYLFMPMDIRNKFVQKLPQTTVGNLGSVMVVATRDAAETSLSVMVAEIKKAKSQLEGIESVQHVAENFKSLLLKLGNEDLEDIAKRSYVCSSLCGFPYNKVDFGWGKPLGSTMALKSADKIGFALKDSPNGDGIEALVILEKEDMKVFQNDKEMLSFSQINQFYF